MFFSIHGRIDRVLIWIENVAAIIAGCAALITMVLVTFDAILRHLFSSPLTFQHHLTQYYLLVMVTMLALSWGYRTGGAIQIKLLIHRLPAALVGPLVRVGLLASAGYIAAMTWQGYIEFHDAWEQGKLIMGVIDWPVAWSWVWIPLGCGLLAVRLLLDATAPRLSAIGSSH
ncbi:TRAP transporter small permease [Halomonas sp. QX-2]|uniref:TRAP transporter small permease protein n=1 Tax=Vreelandella sedimenti TaxID=2729618 RepID=A0A7Z0SRX4_9GAMM|nr:TRAP transporter small permease [Halomonas sedimenti]NYT74994.1 TRAP transporter small permease [Halomonas sedimenti]